MTVELLLPGRNKPAPKPPSRIALDMAFGVGAGVVLGDKSRYRSHGAITTAVWAAGVHGNCLDFELANPDYVVIPAAHTQLGFTTEDFSAIVRLRLESRAAHLYVINRYTAVAGGWWLSIMSNGRLRFGTGQGGPLQFSDSAVGEILINTWYTIGFSRAGASGLVYKDGLDITAAPAVHIDPTVVNVHTTLCIDADLITLPLDGLVEFVRIFRGVALQPSEHLAWHNALA